MLFPSLSRTCRTRVSDVPLALACCAYVSCARLQPASPSPSVGKDGRCYAGSWTTTHYHSHYSTINNNNKKPWSEWRARAASASHTNGRCTHVCIHALYGALENKPSCANVLRDVHWTSFFYILFMWAGARHGFKLWINFSLIVFGRGTAYRSNTDFEVRRCFDIDHTRAANDEANQEVFIIFVIMNSNQSIPRSLEMYDSVLSHTPVWQASSRDHWIISDNHIVLLHCCMQIRIAYSLMECTERLCAQEHVRNGYAMCPRGCLNTY